MRISTGLFMVDLLSFKQNIQTVWSFEESWTADQYGDLCMPPIPTKWSGVRRNSIQPQCNVEINTACKFDEARITLYDKANNTFSQDMVESPSSSFAKLFQLIVIDIAYIKPGALIGIGVQASSADHPFLPNESAPAPAPAPAAALTAWQPAAAATANADIDFMKWDISEPARASG